jgi:formate/nitrite transporter FocA (FNT family)
MVFARVLGFAYDQIGRTTFSVTLGNLIGCAALIGVAYFVAFVKKQPWRVKPK